MENLCRLCLVEGTERRSLFDTRNNLVIVDLVKIVCPGLKIDKNDNFTKEICYDCLNIVCASCDLRERSLESEEYLNAQYEKFTLEIVKVEPENDEIQEEEPVKKTKSKNVVTCLVCKVSLSSKSLSRHMKLKHNQQSIRKQDNLGAGDDSKVRSCSWCSATFKRNTDWKLHVSSCHADQKENRCQSIECSFCPALFGSVRGMKIHLKKIHDLNPDLLAYYCAHCQTQFNDKFRLEIHIKEEHFGVHGKPFLCLVCNDRFMSQTNLRKHLLRRHKVADSNTFFCDQCDFFCLLKSKLKLHMERVHLVTVGDFLCDSCDIVCKSGHEKKLHHFVHCDIVEALDQNLELLSCTICPQQFQFGEELIEHLEVHQDELHNQTTACILCSKVINGYAQAFEHTKCQHIEKFTHKCLECNRSFMYGLKFLIHIRNHKEKKPLDHLCTECGRSFPTVSEMNRHVRVEHKKIYKCPYCVDVVYKSIPSFRQHVDGHTNSRKFKCTLCPKTFSVRNKFDSHYAFHLNDKMNQCPKCGKGFEKPYSLKIHMQRHDGTLVKKHECGFCDKKFRSKWARDGHERTHTNEKPFKCEHCPSAYKQKGDYMKHLKIHVGENVYQCSECSNSFRLLQDLNTHKMNIHHI